MTFLYKYCGALHRLGFDKRCVYTVAFKKVVKSKILKNSFFFTLFNKTLPPLSIFAQNSKTQVKQYNNRTI
jgi:hypothetical protein